MLKRYEILLWIFESISIHAKGKDKVGSGAHPGSTTVHQSVGMDRTGWSKLPQMQTNGSRGVQSRSKTTNKRRLYPTKRTGVGIRLEQTGHRIHCIPSTLRPRKTEPEIGENQLLQRAVVNYQLWGNIQHHIRISLRTNRRGTPWDHQSSSQGKVLYYGP